MNEIRIFFYMNEMRIFYQKEEIIYNGHNKSVL